MVKEFRKAEPRWTSDLRGVPRRQEREPSVSVHGSFLSTAPTAASGGPSSRNMDWSQSLSV